MKLSALTSLRFFAAFGVFLVHFFQNTNGTEDVVVAFFRKIAVEGFIWVGFFFVLSGFILSYSHGGTDKLSIKYLSSFLIKRFARIYPVHIAMLMIWVFGFVGGFQYIDLKAFFVNAFLLQSWVPDPKSYWGFNAVSWSLSCEIFFYLMFAFLVFLRTKYLIVLAAVLLVGISILQVQLYSDVSYWVFYINPAARLLEFVVGMLVFRLYSLIEVGGGVSKRVASSLEVLSIVVIVLFVVVAIALDVGKNFRFGVYYIVPMAFMVLAFSFDKGVVSKFLANRYLVYLGESSYCLYMVHLMFLGYVVPRFVVVIDKNSIGSVLVVLMLMTMLVVPLACLVHNIVERPANKFLRSILIGRSWIGVRPSSTD